MSLPFDELFDATDLEHATKSIDRLAAELDATCAEVKRLKSEMCALRDERRDALEALATVAQVNGYYADETFPRAITTGNRFMAAVEAVGELRNRFKLAERRLAEAEAELVDARKTLGAVCVAGTLAFGERLAEPGDHAAVQAICRVVEERDSALTRARMLRDAIDEALARLRDRERGVAPPGIILLDATRADEKLRAGWEP